MLFEGERVLPALSMRGIAEIVVRELVEHDDVGLFAQRRFVVEILEGCVTDGDAARRHARQIVGEAFQVGTPLRLDPANDDTLAVGREASSVLQEPARFTRSGRTSDVDDEPRAAAELA